MRPVPGKSLCVASRMRGKEKGESKTVGDKDEYQSILHKMTTHEDGTIMNDIDMNNDIIMNNDTTTNNDTITGNDTITILQYNLGKNQSTTYSILNDPSSQKYTALLLQEQYWSKFTESSLLHHSWTLIEPTIYRKQPRSVIYINNNLIKTESFIPISIPFGDVSAVELVTATNVRPMLIINVYNPEGNELIDDLKQYLRNQLRTDKYDEIIVGGDFNLHHPLWNPTNYRRHDGKADELIEIMAENGLNLLLPADTITYPRAGTTIDLVWGNEKVAQAVEKC